MMKTTNAYFVVMETFLYECLVGMLKHDQYASGKGAGPPC